MIRRGKKTFTKPRKKWIRVKFRTNPKSRATIDEKQPIPLDSPKTKVAFESLTPEEQSKFLEQCYKDYWTL